MESATALAELLLAEPEIRAWLGLADEHGDEPMRHPQAHPPRGADQPLRRTATTRKPRAA